MLRGAGEAADGEAPEEDAAEDGHEVADVHGHDCQHAAELLAFRRILKSFPRNRKNSQKISDTRDDSVYTRPNRINREPPRPPLIPALLHDPHILLDAIRRDHHVLRRRVLRQPLAERLPPRDDDVPARGLAVGPALLEEGAGGDDAAEEGGEDDEEDAGAGVGTLGGGGPLLAEEGGVGAREEDYGVAAVAAAVVAGAVVVAGVVHFGRGRVLGVVAVW